jgi:fatty-acyl-CoA synthase
MSSGPRHVFEAPAGLLRIEDCLDADGGVILPAGTTLISLIDRNIANVGDAVAYRYLDYSRAVDGQLQELTWKQLGQRIEAIGARIQKRAGRGDRVAILAPQGLEYVAAFYAAVKAGTIAVPLFAPELPGHAERLQTALADSEPVLVLTTAVVAGTVTDFVAKLSLRRQPDVVVIDEVSNSAADDFSTIMIGVDDVSHLQYTSGSTRPPVGIEITHRAVGINLLQMILSIDLLDRNTHGVSWLPLYHDMGLSMIGFPAVYGGHSTLLSPTAFIRRPQRWIQALSDGSAVGRVVTAAPNFAYEWTAQRGVPKADGDIDLANVVMIIGSEPVDINAIRAFNAAFAPFGLPSTAIKPSYGMAEATLFIATIAPDAEATVSYFDRHELAAGRAVVVAADSPGAEAHVSCGQVARSEWAVIVDPEGNEVPDGSVGEIWLHGNNIGRGYWRRPDETARTFHATLASTLRTGSHAEGVPSGSHWLRSSDLGVYLHGELYVTGRMADVIVIGGRTHYPQHIEASAAEASPIVRRGYVSAFSVPGHEQDRLVVVSERAPGTSHSDQLPEIDAIARAVLSRHGLELWDIRLVPAGAIPRTTSGKLARRACRAEYLAGRFGALTQ